MVVRTPHGGDPEARVEASLPEGNPGDRALGPARQAKRSAVHRLDGLDAREVRVLHRPAAAHAGFAGRLARVVDRDQAAGLLDLRLDRRQRRGAGRPQLEVHRAHGAPDVGVALEGGGLTAGDQQQVVEIGCELAQGVVLGGGVVVGDGDEVEAARPGRLQRLEHRAGHAGAAVGQAGPVRVGGVHVQVAAVPAGPGLHGRGAEPRERAAVLEGDAGGVAGLGAGPQVGNAQHQLPDAGRQGPGKIGGRRLGVRDGEALLVAAAPAAEPLRIADAQVDHRLLVLAGVGELHRQPHRPRRHPERDLAIGLVIGAGHDPGQGEVRGRRALRRLGRGCAGGHGGGRPGREAQDDSDEAHQKRYSTAARKVRPSSGRAR